MVIERALAGAGIPFAAALIEDGRTELRPAEAAVVQLFQRHPEITAVFAHSDVMAIGAMRALRTLGKAIPQDCSVVGCDDIDSAAYTSPPLTTVHMPFYETGGEAMRLLLDMIQTGSVGSGKVRLEVRLIERSSTASRTAS